MEERDRDMVIRVEEQIANVNQNQLQILDDLRDIFNRLEQESKMVTVISGDLKAHLESSTVRWSNLEKQLENIDRRVDIIEDRSSEISQNLTSEKEDRIKADTSERESRSKEFEKSETFQQTVKANIKLIGWIFGALTSIATVVSALALFHK